MNQKSSADSSIDSYAELTSECPVCGSSAMDTTVPSLGSVCEDCGAVATNGSKSSSLTIIEEQTETAESWGEYYTVTNSTEQRMADSLDILESISDRLSLDADTRKRAAEVYTEAAIENLTDGRSTGLTVGAAVVYGTRTVGKPRPNRCIAEAADIDPESLRRAVRLLSRELGKSVPFCPPKEYLPYVADELQLDAAVVGRGERVLESIDGAVLAGKNPVGFAGAALYLAAGGDVTQRKIAGVTYMTTETLRVRVRDCRTAEVIE